MPEQETAAETTETTTETKPEVNPLQAKLDELTVLKDKELAAAQAKLEEMQRRYEIAVKTGSKTPPQNTPAPSSPVGDWVNKTFGTK